MKIPKKKRTTSAKGILWNYQSISCDEVYSIKGKLPLLKSTITSIDFLKNFFIKIKIFKY